LYTHEQHQICLRIAATLLQNVSLFSVPPSFLYTHTDSTKSAYGSLQRFSKTCHYSHIRTTFVFLFV
jgi:hypothetical protein